MPLLLHHQTKVTRFFHFSRFPNFPLFFSLTSSHLICRLFEATSSQVYFIKSQCAVGNSDKTNVQSEAEIIIINRLIQGCNNATRVGVEPRSQDCDHTVAVKTML